MKNGIYWSYNLPLQVWPEHKDPHHEKSPVVDARILNYMPRKEAVCSLKLSELLRDGQTREEFFEAAAKRFENLARLMRMAAKDESVTVYYHDEGIDS